jgi:hypothetical protein
MRLIMDISEKIQEELKGVPDDFIILLETTADKYMEVSMASLKYYLKKEYRGIFVAVNRPYVNLVNLYKKYGIDAVNMYVIDCVSKSQNGEVNAENVAYMENASALTDISLAINENLNHNPDKKLVFFDSITTMLIHNQPFVFARFIHSIFTKMRIKGVGGLLISLQDKTNREIRAEIAQLCDKVIKI